MRARLQRCYGREEQPERDGRHGEARPGGLARVDAATVRKVKNVGDTPAIYLVVGGKGGYVGRDGKLPEGETSPRVGPSS